MERFKKMVILDKILLTEAQWASLRSFADEIVEFSGLRQATEDELSRHVDGADAIVTCWTNIPDAILKSQPQLRYVGFWTNLVTHRINLALAEELGVRVTYIPDYGTTAVSEYVFALLMELLRKPAKQASDTKSGKWPYELLKNSLYTPTVSSIPYHCLEGMKLGIVGYGRIGARVSKIAQAFGMEVSYNSRKRRPDAEARGIVYRELEDLFSSSDVVTIHLSPYAFAASEDAPVISGDLIRRLHDGAIFLNTSAGRLVDEEALMNEAESGRIRVGIDVYQRLPDRKRIAKICEKFPAGYHLFTYRGGWFTQEAITQKGESLITQMTDFLSKKE